MIFPFFTIRDTGQKWRMVTFQFLSRLKKSRTNIERLSIPHEIIPKITTSKQQKQPFADVLQIECS